MFETLRYEKKKSMFLKRICFYESEIKILVFLFMMQQQLNSFSLNSFYNLPHKKLTYKNSASFLPQTSADMQHSKVRTGICDYLEL